MKPNNNNKKQKFYAIRVGHECNKIVTTWTECKKLTDNCKGVKFQSFDTREKAIAYLKDDDKPQNLVKPKVIIKTSFPAKKVTTIKINLDTAILGKFSKLCDEYEVTIDKQIERLIKEWAELY